MTKKHFIAFAAEIKTRFNLDIDRPWSENPEAVRMAALDTVWVICNVARQDNPRFDENRFRAACGMPTVWKSQLKDSLFKASPRDGANDAKRG